MGSYQDLHGSLPWDSEAEFGKSAVLFLKRWVGFRETSERWCSTCAQLLRAVSPKLAGVRGQNSITWGKALAGLQGCLAGGAAFSRKSHQNVAEGTREKPGGGRKMSIMTSPADLLARPLIGCIHPRVRGQDHTDPSPGTTELGEKPGECTWRGK